MKRLFPLLVACLLALSAQAEPLAFGLFGDTPYNHWERDNLPDLIAEMDRENLAFVIHDGDIKNGSSVCSDEVLQDILDVFRKSATPLVYVPGDNEWTDCHRKNNGSYDPVERLGKLREWFFSGDLALGQRPLKLEHQSSDPAFAMYRENVRWEAGGALFVGMNLPGSDNNFNGTKRSGGPVAEFIARNAANRVWLAQAFALARSKKLPGLLLAIQANPGFEDANAGKPSPGYRDFLTQLREETQTFAGQVVLVHGDSHHHQINQPMEDPATKETVKNFTRMETIGSPFFGWVRGTVDATDPQVFRFSPRFWKTRQKAN
ncbi:MAG: hypothetical protein M0P95_17040 [Sulfuritalea sp.]|jgi:hypothetical protein|nr:hypothetical protein [Sulfuritalea sp.]